MRVVLDAGALIAIDRADRRVAGLIKLARRNNAGVVTTAPALGQVWRDGARQALLARGLKMVVVDEVDVDVGKRAGELLARSGTSDVTDAFVALLAGPGDQVLTSDPDDLTVLVAAGPKPSATIVSV